MAAGAFSWKEARRVLSASGLSAGATLGLLWPFGRERRARALLRRRRAVLEAKNHVVDFLCRAQRALVPLCLTGAEALREALETPEQRGMIMAVGITRPMLEETLAARYGSEQGRALDQALVELLADGVLLEAPGVGASGEPVYFVTQGQQGRRYDLSAFTRLLTEGRHYGAELRSRLRQREKTGRDRTHQL
jgi:hypothetical protein